MILVLDSSALITLARIGQLRLLRELAETVHIPEGLHNVLIGQWVEERSVAKKNWRLKLQGLEVYIDIYLRSTICSAANLRRA